MYRLPHLVAAAALLLSPSPAAATTALAAEEPTLDDLPGQIVVDLRDEADHDDLTRVARAAGALRVSPTALAATTQVHVVEVEPGREREAMARVAGDPRVVIVEPLARVHASFVPDDPLLAEQWHLARVGAGRAWDFATGRGVTVAVVDTGIACEDHGPYSKGSDLARTRCVSGFNFVARHEHANDDHGHGTHVAGTIAQSTHNATGAAGVAFHAALMPIKVLNGEGWGSTADVADGIRWAADHGAQVINLSLGGARASRVLQAAIRHALARGCVVVAAAGNTSGKVQYPAALDGVLAVSATDVSDRLAHFSSRGEGVDLAAPGVNVVQQTVCNRGRDRCERYPGYSGTSMAAPHVAGAAALLLSLGVSDPVAVERELRRGARVVDPSPGGAERYGAGILDAAASVQRVKLRHDATRLGLVLALSLLVARRVRRRGGAVRLFRPSFLLSALLTGPGLLFFVPWVHPAAVTLPLDLASRPLGDWTLALGVPLQRWLPLANALLPLAGAALAFGVRGARPALGGVAVGTAAYLGSVALLGEALGPFGRPALVAWTLANAAACLALARVALDERPR